MDVRLVVGYGVLLVLVLGFAALGWKFYRDRQARYRARWRVEDGKLPKGWFWRS